MASLYYPVTVGKRPCGDTRPMVPVFHPADENRPACCGGVPHVLIPSKPEDQVSLYASTAKRIESVPEVDPTGEYVQHEQPGNETPCYGLTRNAYGTLGLDLVLTHHDYFLVIKEPTYGRQSVSHTGSLFMRPALERLR